jgi:hypothetical protein
MPRQPFAPIVQRNPGGQVDVGTNALEKRPELEILIAHCLMAWPPAEAEMALLLAQLLGVSESEAALAVFQSLRRSSAQRDAIAEAARVTLGADSRELLDAILSAHKIVETDRNDLTHGHFGIYSNLPDGIIWMGTKDYIDFKARMELAQAVFTNETKLALYSNTYVYKKPDLERIFSAIKEIASIWHDFILYLRAQSPLQRAGLYRQLCDRKPIARELDLIRRKRTPPIPP